MQKIESEINFDGYFKINLNVKQWSDRLYLYYINTRHLEDIPSEHKKSKDQIIITNSYDKKEKMVCFETIKQDGAYKTVISNECFQNIIKPSGCDLWAPLDIRKPLKMITASYINSEILVHPSFLRKSKIMGEVKQYYGLWYIYHPMQIRTTLTNIYEEKRTLMQNKLVSHKSITEFKENCLNLKDAMLADDANRFLSKFAEFW